MEKRLSHGFQFLAWYTLSKTLDNIWPTFINQVGSAPQSQTDLDAEKSLSPVDERHRLVVSGVAHLPLDSSSARSSRRSPDGRTTSQPAATTIWMVTSAIVPTLLPDAEGNARYVDPGIGFNVVGNLGRNVGLGTGYLALDLRLSKILKVSGTNIEVLAEAFNVTNRVNYSAFTGNIRSSLFGKPVSAFDSRQIQLGAKVDF